MPDPFLTAADPSPAVAAPDPAVPTRALLLAVFALAVVVYAGALSNGYALDDEAIVLANKVVHGLGDLRGILLGPYWVDSGQAYRPVTLLSFALGWTVHGPSPAAMHAVNVALHAACSVLVAVLVLRLRGGPVAAALAGALFAVHPVHVEAVANGVGRAEILATIFVLAGCLVYLRGPVRSPGRIAALAALYLLALGAKEIAVGFPALLLVVAALDRRGERPTVRRILVDNLPLLAALTVVLAAYLGLRVLATGSLAANTPAPNLYHVSAATRVATAVRVWPEYLRLLAWPSDLSAEWGPDTIRVVGWGSPRVWLGVALGLALAACAWVSWRRERWVAAAVAWFALAVLPVSNLLFAAGVLLAERNLYLPSAALAFVVPPLVHAAARGRRELRLAAAGAAAVLLALGAAKTWTRTPVWRSTDSVLYSMMESHPELWWVDWTAGKILVQRGRTDEGLQWYRRAMAKVGHNHAIMNLEYVHVLRRAGRLGETEALLRHSVRTFEGSVPPYTLLAALLIDQGRYAEVPALMDRAEAIPRSGALSLAELNDRRALAWDGLGRLDQALAARRENLRDPFFRRGFVPWYHYARLLALAGDTAGARMAVDSARARTSPRLRPLLTLDPIPSLRSPLVRSWAPIPELSPPPPPAR